jgi:hypothetical protein
VEFGGENKISHNDFASIVSRGFVSDFSRLSLPIASHELNPDLSTDVKVTLFASNGRGRVFYRREFPNYLQYSGISPERLSIFAANPGYPRAYSLCLAELKAYIEINENGLFSIYGVINPNFFLNVFIDSQIDYGFSPYRNFRRSFGSSNKVYYPILSFKDNEPLVPIGDLSYIVQPENVGDPVSVVGSSLIRNFFYTGAGVWTSSFNIAASFAHKYPNTSIFPFSSPYLPGQTMSLSYYVDMDVSYSTTLSDTGYSGSVYAPIIKDSKTGVLLESRQSSSGLVETLKEGILLPFDYSNPNRESFGLGGLSYWYKPAFFLYDDNIYSCKDLDYDNEKGKWNITVQKNVGTTNSSTLGALDPFLVGKTAQEFTLEHSGLDPEFTKVLFDGEIGNYSSETKTLWRYCNSAFIPEFVEWEDKV